MTIRIALSGSAGTGKTTLGLKLAETLRVPYVEEGMRERLQKGLDLHDLTLEDHRDLISDLWETQREREDAATEGFVSDRSSLDFAAFWMHYALYGDAERTDAWMKKMTECAKRYDRVVLLPWGVLPLEHDGVRSTNRWVQLRYQGILEGVLQRFLEPSRLLRMPDTLDLDERTRLVLAQLERNVG